jgi:uncharacterized protein
VNIEMKSKFYDPTDPFAKSRDLNDRDFMIDHYYVKLLKLADTLVTPSARAEGSRRVAFMKEFLQQLESEI